MSNFTLDLIGSWLMVQQVDVVFATCSDHMESVSQEILGYIKMRCYTSWWDSREKMPVLT